MTDELASLKAQVAGQRLVLFRLLAGLPRYRLEQMVDRSRRDLKHVDGGGETIPPTGPAERAAMAEELDLLEDVLNNVLEHDIDLR